MVSTIRYSSWVRNLYIFLYVGVRNCIAVELQYEAVDAYMKLCRFQEEEQQVIREMTSFLLYFKDKVLPSLHQALAGEYIQVLFQQYVSTYYYFS